MDNGELRTMNRERRTHVRRAFSLVEMLVVVATLPLFMVMVSRVFMVLGRDVPRSSQLVLEQSSVLSVLDQVRQDVDQARTLPRSYGDRPGDEATLLIQRSDCVVVYQVEGGKVTRTLLGLSGDPPEPAREWSIPNASIHWSLWGQGTTASAVEVHTHMLLKLRARNQPRLANTHLFFPMHLPSEVTP